MPEGPRASRATTAVLVVALVLVVLTTGVLATVAVLMTRNPGVPLGAPPPQRLPAPIHFAPVIAQLPGPCTTPQGVPDDTGQTCYDVAAGVDVTAVRGIEAIREASGAYAVRITLAPAFQDRINSLTREAVDQQIAIVVGGTVVAAPRVDEEVTDDSMLIGGSFTREQAEAMVARLRGGASGVPPATPPPGGPTGTAPTGGTVPTGVPTGAPTGPAATPPAGQGQGQGQATAPAGQGQGQGQGQATAPAGQGRATTAPSSASSGRTGTAARPTPLAPASGGRDPRYRTCEEADQEGYGPYNKETRPEYAWYIDKDRDGTACDEGDLA
ncbi:excalibur calcium-binding domain-containing protein [Planomonospora alba]|uniref:excalibur calcium-binding domain-containing protein n=1 Tax=Planomonospora alba TaxID=161354 RepID=UPI0031E9CA90